MSVDLVSWPLLSPHVVADEPVLLRPHMPLFQFIPIRSQLSPNHPEPAERCLYFSSIYQRSQSAIVGPSACYGRGRWFESVVPAISARAYISKVSQCWLSA